MRALGYTLILFGIISAVVIMLYSQSLGWSGLTGSIVGIMTGIGFINHVPERCCRENTTTVNTCGCNRF